jgi:hypothetical protein
MSNRIFAHLDTTVFLQYMLCCYLRSLEKFSNTDTQHCKYSIACLWVAGYESPSLADRV